MSFKCDPDNQLLTLLQMLSSGVAADVAVAADTAVVAAAVVVASADAVAALSNTSFRSSLSAMKFNLHFIDAASQQYLVHPLSARFTPQHSINII